MDEETKKALKHLRKRKERKHQEIIINTFLQSFYNFHYKNNEKLFSNLDIFHNLIAYLITYIEEFIINNKKTIDWNKISKASLEEKIKLIDEFYTKLGINLKVEDLITNGIFNPKFNDFETALKDKRFKLLTNGFSGLYEDTDHLTIDVNENNLITDATIYVHEISHIRNIFDVNNVSNVRQLLSESLAFTDEFIFINFLDNKGYNYEAAISKLQNLKTFYSYLYNAYHTIKLFILFDKLGSLSKENYKMLYGYDDDYYKCLKIFYEEIIEKEAYKNIYSYINYSLACALSIYMYIEYLKNNNFYERIKELNDALKDKSVEECLSIIGITGFNEENLSKIETSINLFINELKEGSDLTVLRTITTNGYFEELIKIYYEDKYLAFDKSSDILQLLNFLSYNTLGFIADTIAIPDYQKLAKASKEEKINIINDFYRYIGRNFRIDNELIDKCTTIRNINTERYLTKHSISDFINRFFKGYTYFEDNHKQLDLFDTDLIMDTITWTHELSHYQDQPNGTRNQISFVLTECLAFTEQLVFLDYLDKLGYTYEANYFKYDTFSNFTTFIEDGLNFYKMLNIYVKLGELSKSNYDLTYDDDDYEYNLNILYESLVNEPEQIFNFVRYSIACALSIYMYIEYKKDSNFKEKINELRHNINDKDFYECLHIIGLTGLDNESLNKIRIAIDQFKKELTSILKKDIFKLYDYHTKKLI